MEPHPLQLTTPTEVVLALYDACGEADGALAAGDDGAALAALGSIADLVAVDAAFHLVDVEHVRSGPVTDIRGVLARRGRPERVVVHQDVVVAMTCPGDTDSDDGAATVDVFRIAGGRVDEGWCLGR